MTIGIIGAMDEEIALLQEKMEDKETIEIANSFFITGKLVGEEVVLVKSGIGKVNAAMTTTILIERFQPQYIINTGSAGGFSKKLQVGDIVISNEVVHHDVDATAFDYQLGQVPQMPATYKADHSLMEKVETILQQLHIQSEIGLIATGDTFMADPNRVATVREHFPTMIACEMEAAGIAQVCFQYEMPFVVIRALSDIAGEQSSISFEQFLDIAATNAANVIIEFVKQNK